MIKTALYLDTRKVNHNNESVLKIRLTHDRKTAYISTAIKIDARLWNGRIVQGQPNLNNIIKMYYERVRGEVARLELSGEFSGLSINQIRDKVLASIEGSVHDVTSSVLFLDVYKAFAKSRKSKSTRIRYMALVPHLEAFDKHIAKKTFDDIDAHWAKGFQNYLLNVAGLRVNSVLMYIAAVKAVFNHAIDEEITQSFPFRKVGLKLQPTLKRSLSVEQLRQLINLPLTKETQIRARDYFMLSFYLCGINAVDLAVLVSLNGGRVEYLRAKTGSPVSIKVEPEAMAIIEKYRGTSTLVDIADRHNSHQSHIAITNYSLRAIKDDRGLKMFPGISTYWARHTWATIASELDIPKETIAHALSHRAGSVTDIYINFNRKKIDDANRKVIDYVLELDK